MASQTIEHQPAPIATGWLKRYYFTRFVFSAVWVLLAFSVAMSNQPLAGIMLVSYPAWDAIANFVDARRSGGLGSNKSQMLNFIFSILTAIAVAVGFSSPSHFASAFGRHVGASPGAYRRERRGA